MNILFFAILILAYIGTCYAGVRGYWWTRARVTMLRTGQGRQVALEYGVWIVFVIVLIPFGVFFPVWLSETMNIVNHSQKATMGLVLFGCVVLGVSAYLGSGKDKRGRLRA